MQRIGQAEDAVDTDVALATLDATDVVAMQTGGLSQSLLREALSGSEDSDPGTELLPAVATGHERRNVRTTRLPIYTRSV
jgi:hypothetical protein